MSEDRQAVDNAWTGAPAPAAGAGGGAPGQACPGFEQRMQRALPFLRGPDWQEAPPPPPILEQGNNKRKCGCEEGEGEALVKGVAVRCRSWMCERCKAAKGIEFRKRLQGKAALFKVPRLYSVTVAREWHESPEAAHDHVTKGGFLRRLFRLVGVERWVWVLEAQEQSGDGWPHWHILVDVGDLPGKWYHSGHRQARDERPAGESGWVFIPHFFDLNRVHELLSRWKIGRQCRLSVRRDSFESAEHAVNYITKYLIKLPRRGYPPWMLNRRRLRFVGASKALGRLVAAVEEGEGEGDGEGQERGEERPPVARIAECGRRLRFLQYDQRGDDLVNVGECRSTREELRAWPGAVAVEDFDFLTGRTFTVYGLPSVEEAWAYLDACGERGRVEAWQRETLRLREALLGAWAAGGDGTTRADSATPQNSSERGGLGAIGSADCAPPPLSVRVASGQHELAAASVAGACLDPSTPPNSPP